MSMDVRKRKEKNNIDFEYLEENYEQCIENKFANYLDENNLVPISRVVGYTDVTIAACAALMVISLRTITSNGEPLARAIGHSSEAFVIFTIGFFIIFSIWESINIRSIIIKHLDDFLLLCTIMSMLFVASLPFSFALMALYPNETVSTIIICVALTANELMEIVVNCYAFANPGSLHIYIHKYSDNDLHYYRTMMCLKNVVNVLLFVLAGLLSMLDHRISWAFIALMEFLPVIRKSIFCIHRRIYGVADKVTCEFFPRFVLGDVKKERLRVLTDSTIAVVACLSMIDITLDRFPAKSNVLRLGLKVELKAMLSHFFVFFRCYLKLAFLWYTNYYLYHLMYRVDRTVLYLQKFFLIFVCWLPWATNILHLFIDKQNYDTKLAIRISSSILLCAGICNLLIFAYCLYMKEKLLHKWAVKVELKEMLRKHLHMLLKLMNIPIFCVITILGTLAADETISIMLTISFILFLVTFFLLRFFYFKRIKKHVYRDCELVKKKSVLQYSVDIGVIENAFTVANEKVELNDSSDEFDRLAEQSNEEKKTFVENNHCENNDSSESEKSVLDETDNNIGCDSEILTLDKPDNSCDSNSEKPMLDELNNDLGEEHNNSIPSELGKNPNDNNKISEENRSVADSKVICVDEIRISNKEFIDP